MKVVVKTVFFDNNGVHKVGEVIDVEVFDERRMEQVAEKEEKTTKKTSKK